MTIARTGGKFYTTLTYFNNNYKYMPGVEFTDTNFKQNVLEEAKLPVLVDFWATWCGPCKVQGPIIEEISKELSGQVVVGSLDVDENPETSQSFGIMSIPTLVIFKGGKEIWRVSGLQQKHVILNQLKQVM